MSSLLCCRLWCSQTCDGCCFLLASFTVPQPQLESRPEEHYLEQQARLHNQISHLLLHRPLLLPDHWWHSPTPVTQIFCTQNRSASSFCTTIYITRKHVCVHQWFLCKIPDILLIFVSVNKIKDVRLNSSEHTQALKGQRLVLNCSATAELNTRVNFTWDYPGKVRATLQSLEMKEAHV